MARLLYLLYVLIATMAPSIHSVAGQEYTKESTSPVSSPSSTSAVTSFSSTIGPFIAAYSWSWSQFIVPTIVGTVMVTVNEATNQTWSSTIYHSEYATNGSLSLLTRTDTDAAGTVTTAVYDPADNVNMTITYPTNYFDAASVMTWAAILPITSPGGYGVVIGDESGIGIADGTVSTVGTDGTCCLQSYTLSPTPAHPAFTQTGSINTEDSRGWLYSLMGFNHGDPFEQLDPSEVSSLWTHQSLNITYTGCPHTACNVTASSAAAGASAVVSQANILATSTTTISSAASSSTSLATKVSPLQQSIKSTPLSTEISIPLTSPVFTPTSASAIVFGGVTVSSGSLSEYIVAGQTLSPGASINIGSGSSTTMIAMETSNSRSILVVGSSSTLIGAQGVPSGKPPAITIWSSVVSPNSASKYIIAGQTLAPGSGIVVSGTTITDIGGYIWLGLGGSNVDTSTSVMSTNVEQGAIPTTGVSSATLSSSSSSFSPTHGSAVALSTSSSDSRRVSICLEATTLLLFVLNMAAL